MRIVKPVLFLFLLLCGYFSAFSQTVMYGGDSTNRSPVTVIKKSMYVEGQRDAERNYTKYKAAGTGTLFASLVSPLIGLIPAIACSSTMPKEVNLGAPKPELLAQEDYYLGYTQKAKKIKSRKSWTNWAVGFGVNLAIVVIASAGQ